jgi:hypothetical protein
MVYYTYSQGFRPGGFNQNGNSAHAFTPDGTPQFFIPSSYTSDKLTNNEIGWKTEFFNHRLQWNGAVYRENWDNVQVAFFDPGVVGNIFFNTNGQDFVIKGVETSLIARVTTGSRWGARRPGMKPPDEFAGVAQQIRPAPFSAKPITNACNAFGSSFACRSPAPSARSDSPSANAPPIQFSVRAL